MRYFEQNGFFSIYHPEERRVTTARFGKQPMSESELLESLAAAIDHVDGVQLAIRHMWELLGGTLSDCEKCDLVFSVSADKGPNKCTECEDGGVCPTMDSIKRWRAFAAESRLERLRKARKESKE